MKFRRDLPEAGSSASYLKLKDKESVAGLFQGDPYEFHAIWDGKTYKEVPENYPGSSFRFKINFVVKEGSSYVAKVFENGVSVYRDIANLHEDYPLDKTAIKITRNGTDKTTTYSFLPLPPNQQPKAENLNLIKSVELNKFSKPARSINEPHFDDNEHHLDDGPPLETYEEHPEIPF